MAAARMGQPESVSSTTLVMSIQCWMRWCRSKRSTSAGMPAGTSGSRFLFWNLRRSSAPRSSSTCAKSAKSVRVVSHEKKKCT
jgi:hypothetical protein